ncbi:hypothetical protein GCM10017786_53580 [Amycolatopsis deserti]|uniref:Uncharacterized protein n=1 Tax=Amycolatopsis deserti TaxID=185696 RepID=A0ABQ3JDH6_9PSEU|nr:hypothetical protein GCM10017786_53580 [Amycolatopsis deserti]
MVGGPSHRWSAANWCSEHWKAAASPSTTRWGLDTRVILFVTLPTLPAEDADARERG